MSGIMKTRGATRPHFLFYFLLPLLLFVAADTALGSDSDNAEKEALRAELLDILHVQPLHLPLLKGEVSLDGVLDEPF